MPALAEGFHETRPVHRGLPRIVVDLVIFCSEDVVGSALCFASRSNWTIGDGLVDMIVDFLW